MDRFFDRLGDLLQLVLGSESESGRAYEERDPDMRVALEELDEYLRSRGGQPRQGRPREGTAAGREPPRGARPHGEAPYGEAQHGEAPGPPPPEALRRQYADLEVPFGAPLEEVRHSYKALLRKYHPDRFIRDPEKHTLATEITQRLNDSFRAIREFHQRRGGH